MAQTKIVMRLMLLNVETSGWADAFKKPCVLVFWLYLFSEQLGDF